MCSRSVQLVVTVVCLYSASVVASPAQANEHEKHEHHGNEHEKHEEKPHHTLDPHQLELVEHFQHLAYIAGFKCHAPQPRVIPIHHILPAHETHGKAYFPDATVLHQCDESCGTCSSGHKCHPAEKHPLNLPFKVTFLEDMGAHTKGTWKIEYYHMENHTHCTCAPPPPVDDACMPGQKHHKQPLPDHGEHKHEHKPDHFPLPGEKHMDITPVLDLIMKHYKPEYKDHHKESGEHHKESGEHHKESGEHHKESGESHKKTGHHTETGEHHKEVSWEAILSEMYNKGTEDNLAKPVKPAPVTEKL